MDTTYLIDTRDAMESTTISNDVRGRTSVKK